MKKKAHIIIPVVLLILMAIACDIPDIGEIIGVSDGNVDLGVPSFTGGECESGSTRLQHNTRASGQITGTAYPETCTVFCLWVPDGGSSLGITISDFDVDLDMYVDTNLSVLQYEDHGEWESNDFGTDDESVSIPSPGGRYYIQVCSYEGLPSSFSINSDYR